MTIWVVIIIAIALAFDFFNGFHDAANSIATVVSTRVLSPQQAVVWAAFFNFVAFMVFGTKVAATIANDVVNPAFLNNAVIFAGLLGAVAWDILTWWIGLPTSSSHALVGAMAGAAVAEAGWGALIASGFQKIAVFIVLSPIVGLLLGFTFMVGVYWFFHRRQRLEKLNRGFRVGQLFSAAAFSLAHGANDAQKTMGIILALLIANGVLPSDAEVPLWVVLAAHTAIALGTLFGGWRIVHTMGSKITKLQPAQGMAAESAAAVTIMGNTLAGIPVSTTQTITGAIVGVGSTQRLSAVRWGVAGQVVWAWVLTIPGAFVISYVAYLPFKAVAS
ncbi:MAG TPA: inorganic phosphate transporter [Actinomycetota bacterium]|jgi:inorganic phosphate transporter, PiT family|nr:inorganic phosphate transporter [Actinomycetota bacterium]